MLLSLSLLIFTLCFETRMSNTKKSKNKIIKMIGKTACHSYPKDWWPFTPTTIQDVSLKVTRTIPYGSLNPISPYTIESDHTVKFYDIKPTKFVDFRKSKAYKRLWERTHRGLHWLPPKPT